MLNLLVSSPVAGAFTVSVKFVVPPLVRLVSAGHVTMPELFTPPPLAVMKVTPAGKIFVTNTLLATDAPRLVTNSV